MDRRTFFHQLRKSGLLSGQAIDDVAARFPDPAPGHAITRALVAEGLLTRFQAKKLLAGRGKGLLLKPYCILDQIGRGATGSVFKAMHRTMGRVVAIKIVHPRVLEDTAALDLFLREVRAVAQLRHPSIATAYDAGVARGRHFLVMEYVDGPSLQSLVQTHGPLPVGLACELMRQVAEALHYAHEKGMVHRDIKPANLLIAHLPDSQVPAGEKGSGVVSDCRSEQQKGTVPLSSKGQSPFPAPTPDPFAPGPVVKIIDFGLARVRQTGRADVGATIKVEPGTVWGTVDYIAPEQAENIHAADIRSDLYSLGCTFYYALTGRVPFPGGNDLQKLIKHRLQEAPPIVELRPEIPAALATIIHRLMAKERTRRFQTPAELTQELAGVCDTRVSGIRTPEMQVDDFSREPAVGRNEASISQLLSEPPVDAHSAFEEWLRSAVAVPPIDDALLENWRQWTAIVETFAQGRDSRRQIKARAFQLLRKQLIEGCEAEASTAEGVRREFLLSLAELVKPWLSPDTLMRTETDLLYSLLSLCQRAEQGLHAMSATQGTSEGGQTLLGGLLNLFKRWREGEHQSP